MIEFDRILDKVGHFGKYQFKILSLVSWIGFQAGLHTLAAVFYSAPVSYRCNVPPIDNKTLYPNISETEILNLTTPYDVSKSQYAKCTRYGYDLQKCDGTYSCVKKSAPPISCDMGYHYDTSMFTSTIETEWELVCDRQVFSGIATSVFFVGMWAGATLSGYTSDNFGRRKTMFYCNLGGIVFGIIASISPWFFMFVIGRFFVAAATHGAFLVSCVYVMEITGKYRTPFGIGFHMTFTVGYLVCSLIAYFIRDWRYFYLTISLLGIPYIVFHYFVPESPKWHFAKGHDEKGKRICYKLAEESRKTIDDISWTKATVKYDDIGASQNYTTLDLFKSPRMRVITLNVLFSWFVASLVYFGLSLNVGNLSGSIFVNNALNASMEIFACILVISTMDRYGRKPLLFFSFMIGGVSLIGSMLCFTYANDNQAILITGIILTLAGKLLLAAAFGVMFNFTSELFPTVLRGNAVAAGSMSARWGSILSPFIISLNHNVPWFLGSFLGSLSIIAGFLVFLYPETKNQPMPQTMEDANLLYKGVARSYQYAPDMDELMSEKMDEFPLETTV